MIAIGGRDGYLSLTSLSAAADPDDQDDEGGERHRWAHLFHYDTGGLLHLDINSKCNTAIAVNDTGVMQVFQVKT